MDAWDVLKPQPASKGGGVGAPSVRYGHGAVAFGSYMVVTHGYYLEMDDPESPGVHFLDDTWAFDVVSKTWTKWALYSDRAPCGRFHGAVCADGASLFLFGGTDGGFRSNGGTDFHFGKDAQMNDLWRLPLPTTEAQPMRAWQRLTPDAEGDGCPRKREMLGSASAGGKVWVFGGLGGDDTGAPDGLEALGDLWSFDAGGWRAHEPDGQPRPAARFGHRLCGDGDGFLVCGGRERVKIATDEDEDRRKLFGELWRCAVGAGGPSWTLVAADPALARVDFAMARDGPEVLVYGGNDAEGLLATLPKEGVLCDAGLGVCAPLPVAAAADGAPHARLHATLTVVPNPTDPQRSVLLLFGGESTDPYMYHGSVYAASRLRPKRDVAAEGA